jgi:hypothetical protein
VWEDLSQRQFYHYIRLEIKSCGVDKGNLQDGGQEYPEGRGDLGASVGGEGVWGTPKRLKDITVLYNSQFPIFYLFRYFIQQHLKLSI